MPARTSPAARSATATRRPALDTEVAELLADYDYCDQTAAVAGL